jgi:hypothetical protein
MEPLDRPYWKSNRQPFVCDATVTAEVEWNTEATTFVCDRTDLSPVTAEEVVIGGLRQIMEAVKKLQPVKPEPAPPPEPKPPESYDLAGAAQYLGMTPRKLRELFKARRVAGSRIDYRHYLFTRADLNEFLAAYRSKPKRI